MYGARHRVRISFSKGGYLFFPKQASKPVYCPKGALSISEPGQGLGATLLLCSPEALGQDLLGEATFYCQRKGSTWDSTQEMPSEVPNLPPGPPKQVLCLLGV